MARLVEIDIGVVPEAAISGAVLLQSERSAFLLFNAMSEGADELYHDAGTAIVEMTGYMLTQFGYPNDEAWRAIPRSEGCAYGVFEDIDSDWEERVLEQNLFAFPDTKVTKSLRHFVFLFHDTTFECIAKDLSVEVSKEGFSEIVQKITRTFESE